jgi:uncharacterized flavoprotein (TIGR03862 family)
MAVAGKQVRVVGAGPAGLMAAEVLARAGTRVEIIDHHPHPARKFILAGRGGLNITHSERLDDLLERYGDGRPFLEHAIRAFPPEAVRSWCWGLGIETFIGTSGRVFPSDLKASPLLRAWLRRLEGLGVVRHASVPWQGFDDVPTILAMGGASWPELGSDAAWVSVFQRQGIDVTPLTPSNSRHLVPWSDYMAKHFAGTPVKNVALSAGGRTVRGEIMIMDDGIEGGAIYALSAQLRAPETELVIDLKPDLSDAQVAERLSRPRGKDSRSTFLRKTLNLPAVSIALMKECAAESPKRLHLKLQGPAGLRRAISTAGGVARSEVDENYRLRKVPNTWAVGEMLDWDAPTGGYLLQACFSTARWAAEDCLRHLNLTRN